MLQGFRQPALNWRRDSGLHFRSKDQHTCFSLSHPSPSHRHRAVAPPPSFSSSAFAAKSLNIPSRPSHLVANTGWTQTSPLGAPVGCCRQSCNPQIRALYLELSFIVQVCHQTNTELPQEPQRAKWRDRVCHRWLSSIPWLIPCAQLQLFWLPLLPHQPSGVRDCWMSSAHTAHNNCPVSS